MDFPGMRGRLNHLSDFNPLNLYKSRNRRFYDGVKGYPIGFGTDQKQYSKGYHRKGQDDRFYFNGYHFGRPRFAGRYSRNREDRTGEVFGKIFGRSI